MKEKKRRGGSWKPGQSGNPKGRKKGGTNSVIKELRKQIQKALEDEAKKNKTTLIKHLAKLAFEDKSVMIALLDKLLPDLKSVDANIKSDGLVLNVICSEEPKWKKRPTN